MPSGYPGTRKQQLCKHPGCRRKFPAGYLYCERHRRQYKPRKGQTAPPRGMGLPDYSRLLDPLEPGMIVTYGGAEVLWGLPPQEAKARINTLVHGGLLRSVETGRFEVLPEEEWG